MDSTHAPRGKIKSWNDDRGFGFIAPAQGGQDIFLHISAFPRGAGRPAVGQALTLATGLVLLPAFAVLCGVIAWCWGLPGWVWLVYGIGSVVCFLAYAFDKSAATARRWCTPERTLLLLGLVGGWPGGLLAQQLLCHKTAKPSFRAAFWTTVVLNVAGLLAWTTPILGRLGQH